MRYIDADKLIDKIFPIGLVDDGKYTINAKAVKVAIDKMPTADVVPKSEEGAECPTCHGTGRIGTTNWLTKNMTQKQIAEEKAKAISEHERHIKAEVAREIFEEIEKEIELTLDNNCNERVENINKDCRDCPHARLLNGIQGIVDTAMGLDNIIAELKKKYTESEGNE